MRRSLCCALIVVLACVAAPLAAGWPKSAAQRQTSLEQGILRDVNRVRVAHGLRPLTLSRPLQAAASFQTRTLLTQGVFDHDTTAGGTFAGRLRRFYPVAGARSWSVGENLLWSSAGISAESAVEVWLQSPVHRRTMLDPQWQETGVGAFGAASAPGVYGSAGPVVVVTMDFGARRS
jgi:uncharacterized protein YkwD